MRALRLLLAAIVAAPVLLPAAGCGNGTDVQLINAPPVKAPPPQPVPADAKKGGGKGSSGHMNRNPGGDT